MVHFDQCNVEDVFEIADHFHIQVFREVCKALLELPFDLDVERGPWVTGGALCRAVRGVVPDELDVFFADEAQYDLAHAALSRIATPSDRLNSRTKGGDVTVDLTPDQTRPEEAGSMWWVGRVGPGIGMHVDLAAASFATIATHLGRFDVTAAQMATDGRILLWVSGALSDAVDGILRVSRVTRPRRVQKYLDLGLVPDVDEETVRKLQEGIPVEGWTSDDLTWRQAMGLPEITEEKHDART